MALDGNWQRRLRREHDELTDKCAKLSAYVRTPAFAGLSEIDRHLLDRQLHVMTEYRVLLSMRVARIGLSDTATTEAEDPAPAPTAVEQRRLSPPPGSMPDE